jgi:hypothetical protein
MHTIYHYTAYRTNENKCPTSKHKLPTRWHPLYHRQKSAFKTRNRSKPDRDRATPDTPIYPFKSTPKAPATCAHSCNSAQNWLELLQVFPTLKNSWNFREFFYYAAWRILFNTSLISITFTLPKPRYTHSHF